MDLDPIDPPRRFRVGDNVTISHCADLELAVGERVDFSSQGRTDYAMLRTSWGFLADLPLDLSAVQTGFDAHLAGTVAERVHLLLIQSREAEAYRRYGEQEGHRQVARLCRPADLARLRGPEKA